MTQEQIMKILKGAYDLNMKNHLYYLEKDMGNKEPNSWYQKQADKYWERLLELSAIITCIEENRLQDIKEFWGVEL